MDRRQRDIIQVIRDLDTEVRRIKATLARPTDMTASEILAALLTVDGAGSLLDADLLDGNEAAAFALTGHNHDADYADIAHVGAGGTEHANAVALGAAGFMTGADKNKLDGIETGATADQTAADIRGLGFFDTSNDGTGSGLDADLLDGNEAAAFALSGHTHSISDTTGTVPQITRTISGGTISISGVNTPIVRIEVDTESAAATDDLDDITGASAGQIVILNSAASTRDIVVKYTSGTMAIDGSVDFTLSNIRDRLMLIYDGGRWQEIGRGDNS